MPTCFLVLGTPRSGTSLVAGILHRLGVFVGDRLIEANPMNPAGFYQDVDFEELFDGLPEWMPERIEHHEGHPRLIKLRELVARRCALGIDWGAKFLHAAHVLPDFVAACDQPVKLLVTARDLGQSVASMAAWSEPHDQCPREVIGKAAVAVAMAVRESGLPSLTVSYGGLLADPAGGVARIAAFAGREVTTDAVAFVDPSLRRFR